MTNIIFAVLLSWNMNVGNPFDNFDKSASALMLERVGKEGVKFYRENNWDLFVA